MRGERRYDVEGREGEEVGVQTVGSSLAGWMAQLVLVVGRGSESEEDGGVGRVVWGSGFPHTSILRYSISHEMEQIE